MSQGITYGLVPFSRIDLSKKNSLENDNDNVLSLDGEQEKSDGLFGSFQEDILKEFFT
jgi:hypothetical protein